MIIVFALVQRFTFVFTCGYIPTAKFNGMNASVDPYQKKIVKLVQSLLITNGNSSDF